MHISCPAVISGIIAFSVPVLEAIAMRKYVRSEWYKKLKKPWWSPPRQVYGPVWTALYSAMGYSSYLVWRDGGGFEGPANLPLMLYGSQLVLNWLWGPIFFVFHSIKKSLVDISLLWINVGVCGFFFYGINQTAGYLFIPYFLWVSFASSLNYQIYKLNCTGKEKT